MRPPWRRTRATSGCTSFPVWEGSASSSSTPACSTSCTPSYSTTGGRPGGLSARTVRYIHTIIGRALREAVAWDRLLRNVARAAQPPGSALAEPPEMRTWDGPTLAGFLDLVRQDRHYPAWLFLATTGCRRGEALGLRWKDLDLDARRAVVFQTATAVEHKLRIEPRTKSRKPRPIQLDGVTVAVLRAVRARQAKERLLLGPSYVDKDLVFARPDGHPTHPEHFSMAFDRRVARYKLPRIRLHDLRHTWATLALAAGIDVKSSPRGSATPASRSRGTSISTSRRRCSRTRRRR